MSATLALDCGGLVLPRPAGTTLDALRAASAAARSARARQLALHDGDAAADHCLAALREAVDTLPPSRRVLAFGTPFAAFDLPSAPARAEPGFPPRDPVVQALAAVRHVIGLEGLEGLAIVVPPAAFADGPLLLPHLGTLLAGEGGPVAAVAGRNTWSLTWGDGVRATLPCGPPPAVAAEAPPRLRSAPAFGPVADAAACPAVATAFAAYGLVDGAVTPRLAAALQDALALLRSIWPETADMADRMLDAVVFLAPREGVRSHTSARLLGAVLLSAEDPVSAADVLCHELAHARLQLFLELDPLLLDDGVARHRHPWRSDMRPLSGALLGVHAFVNVCGFYRRLAEHGLAADVAEPIYARQAANVRTAWALLAAEAEPTPLGERLLAELEQEVSAL